MPCSLVGRQRLEECALLLNSLRVSSSKSNNGWTVLLLEAPSISIALLFIYFLARPICKNKKIKILRGRSRPLPGSPAGKWCSLGPASCTGVYLGQLKKWRSGAFSSLFLCLLELCKMELTIHTHVTRKRAENLSAGSPTVWQAATWHGHDFFFFTFITTKYISSFLKTTQNISFTVVHPQ
jgi:hypothetical protein